VNLLFTQLKDIQPYAVGILFAIIYLAEHLLPQRRDLIDYKHDFINIVTGLLNLIIAGLGGYVLILCLSYAESRHFGLLFYLPFYLQVAFGLLLSDLFMYWWHRLNHQLPFLWRFHQFHHTDTKLNTTSAVRFHYIELIISYLIKIPVFMLLGVSPLVVILYNFIFLPIVILHHSNIRISPFTDHLLRHFVVSPRMHRTHHSVLIHETNSNYSSVLPYWDKLFKSYRNDPAKEITFGIDRQGN